MAKVRNPDRDRGLDVASYVPQLQIDMIFDVGANVGQSALMFRSQYPEARIWAFEPVKAAHDALAQATDGDPGIRAMNVAFGAADGKAFITADGTRPVNHIVTEASGQLVESVRVVTGDGFCSARKIERVNFLKIDTEGHDLDVLKGFATMLRDQRVDLVQVEAAMTSRQPKHVPLHAFQTFLEPLGYYMFRIYDQISRRHPDGPELALVNALFVSDRVIEANTRRRKR